jgi:DeoR/GlpR family transcriptional regulator of sugar metabolism
MLREHRWQKIEDALQERPFWEIHELAKLLRVSDATVRRDLLELDENGKLQRTRGGAMPLAANDTENTRNNGSSKSTFADESLENVTSFAQRAKLNAAQKQQIGKAASALVQDGQTVMLAGGTTCFAAGSYLRHRRVSVVTNSLPAASHLGEKLGVDVLVTGGLVYPKHDILIGPQLKQSLQQVQTADWLFLSGSGCDADGFYDANHLEIEAQRELMQRASRVALLLDSTKIARRDLLLVSGWDEVDMIITNDEPPADLRRVLNKNNVKLVVAKE